MKQVLGCVLTIALASLACQAVAHAQRERTPVQGPIAGQQAWTPPRTPDGRPDLQGIWDYRSATPLERPARFAGREFMTPAEVAEYERLAAEREDGRPPDDPRTEQSVHPAWWLDYGKTVVKTARTSLMVDPPDGRIPALSAEGEKRVAARRAAARTRGPSDNPEDRSLFERCITRGVPAGMLPGPYNNNLQIIQTPGYVVLFTEMIHDARIVPMDGRPHAGPNIREWLGDSRGHWEGDTLVVDTTNFRDETNFRGSGANLHLVERFTLLDAETLEYRFTVDDPSTWTRPWTVSYPMAKTEGPIYEYACHEGNYGLMNILSGARWQEKAAEEAARKKTVAAQEDPLLGNWRGTLASSDGTETPLIISIVKRGDAYAGTTTGLRESSEVPLTRVSAVGQRVTIEATAESKLGDVVLIGELIIDGNTAKGSGTLNVGAHHFPLTLQLQRRARSDVIQPQVEQGADYFVGRWKFDYVGGDYPPLSRGTRTGTAMFSRVGASHFVAARVQGDVAGKPYSETLLIGIDPAVKSVVLHERLADGTALLSLGNWQSPLAITFQTAPIEAGGRSYQLRRVISVTSPAAFGVLDEFSVDGGPFRRLGNGRFTRIE